MAKWSHGRYHADGRLTSWLKVKNPAYSQMNGRRELFDQRGGTARRTRQVLRPIVSDDCVAAVSGY